MSTPMSTVQIEIEENRDEKQEAELGLIQEQLERTAISEIEFEVQPADQFSTVELDKKLQEVQYLLNLSKVTESDNPEADAAKRQPLITLQLNLLEQRRVSQAREERNVAKVRLSMADWIKEYQAERDSSRNLDLR